MKQSMEVFNILLEFAIQLLLVKTSYFVSTETSTLPLDKTITPIENAALWWGDIDVMILKLVHMHIGHADDLIFSL